MKQSIYNTRLKLREGVDVIFNSLSQEFLLSKPNTDILSVNINTPLYEELVKKGFIVDEEVDEVRLADQLDKETIQRNDFFRLTINPTLDCNLHCWYCYEAKVKNSIMAQPVIASTLRLIDKLSDKHDMINISFFGGEPFKAFDEVVIPILDYATKIISGKKKRYTLAFTTNGTLITNKRIEYLKNFNPSSFQITLDGSSEFHNKVRVSKQITHSYSMIMNNVKELLQNGFYVTLRVNYTDKNVGSLCSIASDISETIEANKLPHLFVNFHQVWQNSSIDLNKEIDEVLTRFTELGIKASRSIFNNMLSPCYADFLNSAIINYNGDVYKCTAVDFFNTKREGYLNEYGDIIWESDCQAKRSHYSIKSCKCSLCRIRPVCNGGCSQKPINYRGNNYCLFSDEAEKDRVVLDILTHLINKRHINNKVKAL